MAQVVIANGLESPAVNHEESHKKAQMRQLIVFRLGSEEYGLTIEQVKEIVIMPNVTRIPLTPPYVKGVANIRGNILAIIDLAEKFGLNNPEAEPAAETTRSYILVMESENLKMGILVKEVPSTLSVTSEQIDQSPSVIQDSSSEGNYIKGIVRAGSRLIILIDVYKIISKEVLQSATSKKV
jgi:purine-binding chemotaxis protein CheW